MADFLAQTTWQYKVTRSGQVYLHVRADSLGQARGGQTVDLRFDPAEQHFAFSAATSGGLVKRLRAQRLDATPLTV